MNAKKNTLWIALSILLVAAVVLAPAPRPPSLLPRKNRRTTYPTARRTTYPTARGTTYPTARGTAYPSTRRYVCASDR